MVLLDPLQNQLNLDSLIKWDIEDYYVRTIDGLLFSGDNFLQEIDNTTILWKTLDATFLGQEVVQLLLCTEFGTKFFHSNLAFHNF